MSHFKDYFQQFLQLFSETRRDGSTSIFDGSKMGANASRFQSRTKATYERWLVHLEEDIKEIEKELQKEADANQQAALQVDMVKKKNCVIESPMSLPR